jgi:hypothetical protein
MNFRKPSSRWALWAFAAALLLKSAMPWLASASAEMQGKTLVEVCSVYGVALVPVGDASGQPTPDHAPAHGGDHCALTALAVLGTSEPPALAVAVMASSGGQSPRAQPGSPAHDACAAWAARLKHGPPSLA